MPAPRPRRYHFQVIPLRAFDPAAAPPSLALTGEFDILKEGQLRLRFNLNDTMGVLVDAPRAREFSPADFQRADGLWQSTCFEAFWSAPGEPGYFEVNIAADGRWNLYRFDDYRTPQPPMAAQDFELIQLETRPGFVEATLSTRLPARAWEVSLCAVLRTREAGPFYFSTHHSGPKPDFHRRDSFNLIRRP